MRTLLLLVPLLASVAVSAQPSVTVSGFAAVPQGSFADALGTAGGGLAVGAFYNVPRSPVAVGLEGTVALYGYERREVPLSLTIPDVRVGVTTSNNLAQGLAVLRLQVPGGAVRPYVDGVAGLTYLFTETSVGDDDHYGSGYGEPLSSVNYDDLAFTTGAGLGVQVRLGSFDTDEGRPGSVSLDARVRYLSGTEATFLGRGDIDRFRDGTIRVYPRRSRTDFLAPHLGVTFTF
ncbi:hypothetical protein [Rubrivirga marina]|uniref:Outer membrane protein beta-barrel domain-containing protein n=1 Tax=Rubrivirga marina TaxID=1196024 RepID=A0A271IYM3_9BACT|nr:hypothetical protein [Rubrivirga marina]PAP75795.1 hypothetical protein BSZ37_04735 [Rubrivirga marina]